MLGRAKRRAPAVLAEDVRAFAHVGYRPSDAPGSVSLGRRLEADGRMPIRLELRPIGGRVFGGSFVMEVATAEPLLPRTRGISARGRGVVRMRGIGFRARAGDEEGARLAERLGSDERLARALSEVHFEQVRVDPDGRAVIRHMGGALVWMLFPPLARPVPIVPEQVRATIAALEAFVRAGAGDPG